MNTILKKVKQARVELVLLALMNIGLGVLMVLRPKDVTELIGTTAGIVMIVWGIIRIISYFRVTAVESFSSFGLVQGIALIASGTYVIVHHDIVKDIFAPVASVLVMVGGVIMIQYAVELNRMGHQYWWIELIAGVMLLVLSAIALFFDPFKTVEATIKFIGISLIVGGVLDLASIIRISILMKMAGNAVKKLAKEGSGTVVDGEIVEVTKR